MTSGDGVVHGASYNAQLQPSGITATGLLSGASANLLSLTLGYSGSGNNGNVVSQQIQRQYLNTTLQTFNATDSYSYTDGMNRLNAAAEASVWSDSYIYDCMSNRAVTASSTSASMLASNFTPQTTSTSSCVLGGASPSVPFDANNRWTAASYDAAGDMTGIYTQTMQYDAERRLIKLTDTGTPAATVVYGYDADGRRVVKTTSAGTTIYVYGPDGELAGESSTIPSASIAGTEYVTADHLGSTRLTTDSQGSPLGYHDYLPFGQNSGELGPEQRAVLQPDGGRIRTRVHRAGERFRIHRQGWISLTTGTYRDRRAVHQSGRGWGYAGGFGNRRAGTCTAIRGTTR